MNLVLFSLFSGINIAFAILSFFIYSKNRSQSMCLYFVVFSLFSGLYFLLQSVSVALFLDFRTVIIFSAAMCYGEYKTSAVYDSWEGPAVKNSFRLNISYTMPVGK